MKSKSPKGLIYLKVSKVFALTIAILFIVLGWNVSNADSTIFNKKHPVKVERESFSVIGTVTAIDGQNISLDKTDVSDESGIKVYAFSTEKVKKIETADYAVLTLADIHVGDSIIAQGVSTEGVVNIFRIVVMAHNPTVTTTESYNASSSTESVSTTTEEVKTEDNSSSTESEVQSTSTVETKTTTEESSSSTETVQPEATVTPAVDVTPSPEPSPEVAPDPAQN